MVLKTKLGIRERVRQSAVVSEESGLSTLTFQALGTRCRVILVEPTRRAANEYLGQVLTWVADFESRYSRFLEDSLIGSINSAAGKTWVEVDEETERLFNLCNDLFFLTHGAFDPTALPLIRLWNWKANPPTVPSDERIQTARALTGWSKVQRRPGAIFLPQAGMCLDLGGIGKEYAVDMVVALAAQFGVEHVLVDFGQDIRAQGHPPDRPAWHVGLENPRNPGACWGSVAVTQHAVASSGDYLRHFVYQGQRYGHIIDPRTGYPVHNGCLAVNVVGSTCTIAGILSTTAFILGPQDGFNLINGYHGAAGAILTQDGNLITPRFYEHLIQPKPQV
ncbi:MAG TPA: FAD:protein FMN transferase [Candidatus Acidoferrum sp.]|nr:FAD:protein FMN transferase [Candidatus Acidoferrum sp.]